MVKARRTRETSELSDFLLRMVRALVKRAAKQDLGVLSVLKETQAAITVAMGEAVAEFRKPDDTGRPHYTWEEIGAELGVTKQSAQITWGRNR